mmetsp:Transcript_58861/g.120436  ORF Transcript_58861/g.120436 Transcript_58861/m.120436 type:complete len:422 (-) Transcript_58861:148-1413(-)|eukprot:CAMPEP_0181300972 /NCGR_PEP_ID=MMETSP1101-20121128/7177_1 /TAXON_ID=46948 /ORGANISM="Rhodomonas abbreviata, Strain Caron Lab Isolate" /LENGTH=421 /DNA_ID=CAMNT_0023406249 /DNA_START=80 /DNA_END=1345 /DNA_ORIENTATION=+
MEDTQHIGARAIEGSIGHASAQPASLQDTKEFFGLQTDRILLELGSEIAAERIAEQDSNGHSAFIHPLNTHPSDAAATPSVGRSELQPISKSKRQRCEKQFKYSGASKIKKLRLSVPTRSAEIGDQMCFEFPTGMYQGAFGSGTPSETSSSACTAVGPGSPSEISGALGVRSVSEEAMDISSSSPSSSSAETRWKCNFCNLYFVSSQALGGHRKKCKKSSFIAQCGAKQQEDLPAQAHASYESDSNQDTATDSKRVRRTPMAHMPGYTRVVAGFSSDVRIVLSKIQRPAAFFSSCSLLVFKQHAKFGDLARLIICKHFCAESERFEAILADVESLPELKEAGFSSNMAGEEVDELKIFVRMLKTKKKFLDVNRRAVSKRIKSIRMERGERLKNINKASWSESIPPSSPPAVDTQPSGFRGI